MEGIKIGGYAVTSKVMEDGNWINMDAFDDNQLKDWLEKNPVMLYNHDMSYPIGKWTHIERRKHPDGYDGLYVEGEVLNNVEIAKNVFLFDVIKNKTLKTLSITFEREVFNFRQDGKIIGRYEDGKALFDSNEYAYDNIKIETLKAKIIEVSAVTLPNNAPATIETVENLEIKEAIKEQAKKSKNNKSEKITFNLRMKPLRVQNSFNLINVKNSMKTLEEAIAKIEELSNALETLKTKVEEIESKEPTNTEEITEEVKETIKEELKEEVKEEITEEVKTEVKEGVAEEIKTEVKEEITEEVKTEVKEEITEEVKKQIDEATESINTLAKNALKTFETNVKNKMKSMAVVIKKEQDDEKLNYSTKTLNQLFSGR